MAPHNLPMTVLGAAILWFGWFGFNAGSALAAGGLSAGAFVATHLAASAATLSWVCAEWVHRGKPTVLGAASGCVAGLVGSPGRGFVTPMAAIVFGLAVRRDLLRRHLLKGRFGYDDSLDVVGVHFVGGMFGALARGCSPEGGHPAGAVGCSSNPKMFLVRRWRRVAMTTPFW
jgi:Amt family ammonium transporter